MSNPSSQTREAAPAEGRNIVSTPSKGRILLADDENSSREALAGVLRDEGYEVDAAADGLEALAALGDKIYDVVITDLRMP
jgi:CheY-like chemotaxis protein